MPRYIQENPIAICDRCRLKFPKRLLSSDRDKPGLLVCKDCNDVYDPWKLPPRQTEDISVPGARPDADLTDI